MATAKLYNANGEFMKEVDLPASLFDAEISEPSMYLAIKAYQANQRQGTHKTKTKSEVSGGGQKPWKQKGTGRARSGQNTSPVWVRGSKAHGPKPRDYSMKVNKKVRRRAFLSALTLKARGAQIHVFEKLSFEAPKTQILEGVLAKAGLTPRNTLVLVADADTNLTLSARNIPWVRTMRVADANTYELVRANNVVLSQDALGHVGGSK